MCLWIAILFVCHHCKACGCFWSQVHGITPSLVSVAAYKGVEIVVDASATVSVAAMPVMSRIDSLESGFLGTTFVISRRMLVIGDIIFLCTSFRMGGAFINGIFNFGEFQQRLQFDQREMCLLLQLACSFSQLQPCFAL